MSKLYKLGVIGNPIEHSLSPFIHSRFARNEKIPALYKAYKVDEGSFNIFIKEFFSSNESLGLNVTLPFKKLASELDGEITKEAKKISAVNTIKKNKRILELGNTDGIGFIDDLRSKDISLNQKEVLIIGAGGASESILFKIIAESPKKIYISNRTTSKAEALIDKYKDLYKDMRILEQGNKPCPDIIINGSSAGLTGGFNPIDIKASKDSVFYDLNYSLETTPFCEWSLEKSSRVFDGMGMLVNQAAYSFNIWFGIMPETQKVIEDLRSL